MLITLNQLRLMSFYLFFKRMIAPHATIAPEGMPDAQFTRAELVELIDTAKCFVGEEGGSAVVLHFREAGSAMDDAGRPCPAGLYLSDAEYPEEGVIPVECKAYPIGAAIGA